MAMVCATVAEAAEASTGTPATVKGSSAARADTNENADANPRARAKMRRCMGKPIGRLEYIGLSEGKEAGAMWRPCDGEAMFLGLPWRASDLKRSPGQTRAI